MRNVMKRFFAGTLAFMMLFAMTGCKSAALSYAASDAPVDETVIPIEYEADAKTGGWEAAEDNGITDEQRSLFEKAMEGLIGVNYEPIAYMGSQVVAGLNHCFLCKATVVYPGAQPSYKMVYIYEALDGHAEVLDITDVALGVSAE